MKDDKKINKIVKVKRKKIKLKKLLSDQYKPTNLPKK